MAALAACFGGWTTAGAQSASTPPAISPASAPAASPASASDPQILPLPRSDRDKAAPIVLRALSIRGRTDLDAIAEGDVEFQRGGITIQADRLSYQLPDDLARASGNVQVRHEGNLFSGPELQLHVQKFEGYFLSPTYFFSALGAGGRADRIDFIDDERALLTQATYSSCLPDGTGAPAWVLSTDRVKIDLGANEGLAEGAVLRFYGVPILGAPVMSFPLNDARKSGWLPPTFNLDNKSGFQVEVPYYWNIAPQRDATISPTIMTRRGAGLGTEFRYLEPDMNGTLNLHWLPHDIVLGQSRYATDLRHEGTAPYGIDYRANVLRVSDDDYWKDFSRDITSITPRLLPTDINASRAWTRSEGDWTTYARVERWQVLQGSDPTVLLAVPYQRDPQIGARYGSTGFHGFGLSLETEFNRFSLPGGNTDGTLLTGQRFHVLGSISRPYTTPGWTLTPRVAVNAASYAVDAPMIDGRHSASRLIPTFSLDSVWVLERDSTWFGRAMRQTLEPRLLYVNTPYRNQLALPNFDSAPRDFNLESIYAENAFSGVDRVSDANQITAGVTTRLLDAQTGAETLRLGAVQRFLFRDQNLTIDCVPVREAGTTPPECQPSTQHLSDLLLLASTSLVRHWNFDTSLQYSPNAHRTMRSILSARYAPGPFRTVSMTYRYARDFSEQVELGWQWPIYQSPVGGARLAGGSTGGSCAGRWYSVGRINYSMQDSRLTDSVVGFEFDAGCWIGRVVAERLSTGRSEATTRLLLQLELVGLSRIGSNPLQVLKDNIPGYRLLRDNPSAPAIYPSYD